LDSFAGNIEVPQSIHKYLYAHANPINNVDPSGQSILSVLGGLGLFVTAPEDITAGSFVASYAVSLALANWQLFYGLPVAKELRRFASAVLPFSPRISDQVSAAAKNIEISLGIKAFMVGLSPAAMAISPTGTLAYTLFQMHQLVSNLRYANQLLMDGLNASTAGGISLKANADLSYLRISKNILLYNYFPQSDIAAATNILNAISAARNPVAIKGALTSIVANANKIAANAHYWANSVAFEVTGRGFRIKIQKFF
jgi:hypothetical protein